MTRPVRPGELAARFLADGERQATHDRLVWNMRARRDQGAAELREWEELRELASRIKEHTLTHLAGYLEQFEANAQKHGTQVHWARDAQEHNTIIRDILQAHRVASLVKSKSMLQDECGLTPYLEQHGIEVTESDLGERIQQLDQEPPSHIVAPAIHKLRRDVAAVFARKLGTDPGETDPYVLSQAMRRDARPRFLKAGAGMTGANFAVAETGGFVVVTNEGNADLGACLPPLHIASIGIEKLISRAVDLGVFIRMLSRSAVGSPISQYTSHFHGPRPAASFMSFWSTTRSARLGSPDFWTALKCIRCGACMNTCPVYRRGGGLSYGAIYGGPIGIILDPTYDEKKYRELPYHSSICGSCSEICPVKIDIADQIYKWRRVVAAKGLLPLGKAMGMKVLGATLARPAMFRLAESAGEAAIKHLPRFLLYNPWNAWGRNREMPAIPKQTFRQWYIERNSRTESQT